MLLFVIATIVFSRLARKQIVSLCTSFCEVSAHKCVLIIVRSNIVQSRFGRTFLSKIHLPLMYCARHFSLLLEELPTHLTVYFYTYIHDMPLCGVAENRRFLSTFVITNKKGRPSRVEDCYVIWDLALSARSLNTPALELKKFATRLSSCRHVSIVP